MFSTAFSVPTKASVDDSIGAYPASVRSLVAQLQKTPVLSPDRACAMVKAADTSRRLLQQSGYTLQTVLPFGERFYLQEKITASTGSDYIDCTEALHPDMIQKCIEFSRQFSTLTVGFDVLSVDISRPLSETGGAFNEYNFLPYVDLHEHCNIGQKRPVCRLIWDYIEANESRIVTPEFNAF